MFRRLKQLWFEERGQAMIEYAIVGGAIALGVIVSLKLLGAAFGASFAHQARALQRAR